MPLNNRGQTLIVPVKKISNHNKPNKPKHRDDRHIKELQSRSMLQAEMNFATKMYRMLKSFYGW